MTKVTSVPAPKIVNALLEENAIKADTIREALGASHIITEHNLLGHPYRIASDSAAILKSLSPSVMSKDGKVRLTGPVLILGRADWQFEPDAYGLSHEEITKIIGTYFWSAYPKGAKGEKIMVLKTED